ncbi:MAG TPA: hypothetical protein VD837_10675 [Terriglobales bacterium]|nr:hypothetical protein [Terriglobales bacterium]
MGVVRLVACAVLFTFLTSASTHSEVRGETRTVTVPFRAEPWSATVKPRQSTPRPALQIPEHEHERQQRERREREGERQVSPPREGGKASTGARATVISRITGQESTAASTVGKVFEGPVDLNPPDSDIGAGPNHLVVTVNSVVAIYDKSGKLISETDINSFFGSITEPGCCFDLRVLFEPTHNRFIVAAGQTDFGASSSHVYVAVSASSDPTGDWYKYSLEASNTTWSDFPTIGFSPTGLYLTTDGIPFSGGGRAIWLITVIGLAELVAGSPNLKITKFSPVLSPSGGNVHGPVIPARTYGSPPVEYLVSTGPPGVLYIYSINTTGTPTLKSVQLNTEPFPAPGLAPQPETSVGLAGGGDAVFTVVWRDDSLWVTQGIGAGPEPGTGALIRWYEIDPTAPALKQMGTVAGVGSAIMPALTVRPDGDVDMVYTTSSPSQFASGAFSRRSRTDPPNTTPISGIYIAGTTPYGDSRWGDISGISVDPDGKSTWGITQYARPGDMGYGTSIVQLLALPKAATTLKMTANPQTQTVSAGQTATYTLAIEGQNTSAVSLACSGLPAGMTCSFDPNPVPQDGKAASLRISTVARNSAAIPRGILFAAVPLAVLVVVLVPRRARPWAAISILVVIALGVLVGCGGVGGARNGNGSAGNAGTPAGAYTITITGTASAASATTDIVLVVQ